MAAQKRKAQSQRGIVIFLAVVLVSGGLLWSTGNMKNPFSVIPNIANLITNGYQPKGGNNNATQANAQAGKGTDNTKPATGDKQPAMAASATPAPAPKAGGGGKDNNTIQWNQFGNVLFNFWYLAATAATLILLGQLISLVATVSKKLRRSARPVVARS